LEDGPAVTGVSLAVGVGLICALLSALGTNLSFLFKYKGAVAAPDVDMRHRQTCPASSPGWRSSETSSATAPFS